MIYYLKYMLRMFHQMEMDDVIHVLMVTTKQIMDSDDNVTQWDATHIAVENQGKIILEKAREAKARFSDKMLAKNSESGSGMYLNPWKR